MIDALAYLLVHGDANNDGVKIRIDTNTHKI